MAQIGVKHGSKSQLLHFLGHRQEELKGITKRGLKIQWLQKNGEFKGINFLPFTLQQGEIGAKWKVYWPQTGNPPNWDAILYSKSEDEWIIVEAKAHLGEIKSPCKAKKKESLNTIKKAFEATRERFGIQCDNDWLKKYYQLANRLAFVHFLLENKIKASLLYIYFLNGWIKGTKENVLTEGEWEKEIREEYRYLGINDNAEKYIHKIFVEC